MFYQLEVNKTEKYCYINAMNKNHERIGKICIDLNSEDSERYKHICTGNKIGKIILVSTSISACGHGVATAMIKKAIEILNDYNLYLNVVPMPRSIENAKYCTVNGLKEFYKKFGFIHYKEDICITTMFRKAHSLLAQ